MAERLRIVPLTLADANQLVTRLHRHHKRVVSHRFSLGAMKGQEIVGAAIVGRPVARLTDQRAVAEVTRLVTDGTPNACSLLYAACARVAREMGFASIQTFILATEPGTSLVAAGWEYVGESDGGDWNRESMRLQKSWLFPDWRRTDQPMGPKRKYEKRLRKAEEQPCRVKAVV